MTKIDRSLLFILLLLAGLSGFGCASFPGRTLHGRETRSLLANVP